MADPPPNPDRDASSDRRPTTSTPPWVKVSGIVALLIVLLLIILLLTGDHGPSRHTSFHGLGGQPSSFSMSGHDRY
jgi:hypothetical protein